MKKLLIISLLINLALVSVYVGRRLTRSNVNENYQQERSDFFAAKNAILSGLPIDSNDVVFIGNSITEGFYLQEKFNSLDVKNRGVSGSVIAQISERLEPVINGHPAKIFIMMGTNDIKNGEEVKSSITQAKTVVECIKKGTPKTQIFIQSVLPTSGKYDSNNNKIIEFNNGLKAISAITGSTYVDLHTPMNRAGFKNLTYDGLHLNNYGYQIWFDAIKDIASP